MSHNKKYTAVLAVVGVIQVIFSLTVPLLSKYLLEAAEAIQSGNAEMTRLYLIIGITVGCLLGMIISKVIFNMLFSSFVVKRERVLKNALYDEMIGKEVSALVNYHAGEIEQLFHEDIINVIKNELSVIPSIIIQIARLIISVALMLYIDWKFLVFILICGICGFGFAKLYSHIIKPHHKKVLEADGEANSFLVESVNQMKLIQSYEASPYASEYYTELNDKAMKEKKKRNTIMYGANSGLYAFSNIIYIIALCYGAFFISRGDLTYGGLLAIVELLNNIQNPILSMSPLMNHYSLGKTSDERIKKLLDIETIQPSSGIADFDKIIFENVSFTYDKERYIFKNYNLEINKGETVLFSGPSGIGKTTLFMLLLGFLKPTEGRIYILSEGKEIPVSGATRSLFSYVPQENIVFSGTVKDNLYILTGKSDEKIEEALKKANLYDELMAMPEGLNTKLSERGNGLSLGQIQRVLIAAAILKDNPVLLLDEFSSALDDANEEAIIHNLKDLNKTIIYITHRHKGMDGERVVSFSRED